MKKPSANNLFVWRWLLAGLMLVLMLLAAPGPIMAQGPDEGDRVLMGENLTLARGETRRGDVVILSGQLRMEPDSMLDGDVAVIGGSATVAGTVTGDVAVIGGSLRLEATAFIQGDVVSVGGTLERHPQAIVRGNIAHGFRFGPETGMRLPFDSDWITPPLETTPPRPRVWDWLGGFFLNGLTAVALATLMAVLGVLLVVAFPQPTGRVAQTVRENPVLSFGVGLLTEALALPLLVVLTVTICLAPLALLTALALVAAWMFGWLAVGWVMGQWLARAFNARQTTPVLEMAVGVILLTLLWRLPLVIPCLGRLVSAGVLIVAGSIGLGAVLLSRFGSQLYRPGFSQEAPALPPVAPAPEEATPAKPS
ncbi:MAG: polymer-forming cytoskeletal protein [Caldilineales bacterium]|nr:polymer-forming cytoskeletal protein [Caldilineales bacterium]